MATYITVADVDAQLGTDWAPEADKARFVAMANAYLSAQGIQVPDPVPADVIMAGVELAAAAADGSLYAQQSQGALTQKRVKADGAEVEKRYAEVSAASVGTSALPSRVQFALALIAPYKAAVGSITVGYRRDCP